MARFLFVLASFVLLATSEPPPPSFGDLGAILGQNFQIPQNGQNQQFINEDLQGAINRILANGNFQNVVQSLQNGDNSQFGNQPILGEAIQGQLNGLLKNLNVPDAGQNSGQIDQNPQFGVLVPENLIKDQNPVQQDSQLGVIVPEGKFQAQDQPQFGVLVPEELFQLAVATSTSKPSAEYGAPSGPSFEVPPEIKRPGKSYGVPQPTSYGIDDEEEEEFDIPVENEKPSTTGYNSPSNGGYNASPPNNNGGYNASPKFPAVGGGGGYSGGGNGEVERETIHSTVEGKNTKGEVRKLTPQVIVTHDHKFKIVNEDQSFAKKIFDHQETRENIHDTFEVREKQFNQHQHRFNVNLNNHHQKNVHEHTIYDKNINRHNIHTKKIVQPYIHIYERHIQKIIPNEEHIVKEVIPLPGVESKVVKTESLKKKPAIVEHHGNDGSNGYNPPRRNKGSRGPSSNYGAPLSFRR